MIGQNFIKVIGLALLAHVSCASSSDIPNSRQLGYSADQPDDDYKFDDFDSWNAEEDASYDEEEMLDDELYAAYEKLEKQMENMPLADRVNFSILEIKRIMAENRFDEQFSKLTEADAHIMASGDPDGKFDPADVEAFEIYNFLAIDLQNLKEIKEKLDANEKVDESSLFELMMNVQDDIILSDQAEIEREADMIYEEEMSEKRRRGMTAVAIFSAAFGLILCIIYRMYNRCDKTKQRRQEVGANVSSSQQDRSSAVSNNNKAGGEAQFQQVNTNTTIDDEVEMF